jgi:hypothetical protein
MNIAGLPFNVKVSSENPKQPLFEVANCFPVKKTQAIYFNIRHKIATTTKAGFILRGLGIDNLGNLVIINAPIDVTGVIANTTLLGFCYTFQFEGVVISLTLSQAITASTNTSYARLYLTSDDYPAHVWDYQFAGGFLTNDKVVKAIQWSHGVGDNETFDESKIA